MDKLAKLRKQANKEIFDFTMIIIFGGIWVYVGIRWIYPVLPEDFGGIVRIFFHGTILITVVDILIFGKFALEAQQAYFITRKEQENRLPKACIYNR